MFICGPLFLCFSQNGHGSCGSEAARVEPQMHTDTHRWTSAVARNQPVLAILAILCFGALPANAQRPAAAPAWNLRTLMNAMHQVREVDRHTSSKQSISICSTRRNDPRAS